MDSALEIERSARVVLRCSLVVAIGTSFLGLMAWKVGEFHYWRELFVGTSFMLATTAFYSELGQTLLLPGRSLIRLGVVATLKLSLLTAIILPIVAIEGTGYSSLSSMWFVIGFLTLIPTGVLLAWTLSRPPQGSPEVRGPQGSPQVVPGAS